MPRFCHITPALRSLHWLQVKLRSTFKILGISSKAINSFALNYISSLIKIKQPSNYILRSNNDLLSQPITNGTKKTLGDRAFASAAP